MVDHHRHQHRYKESPVLNVEHVRPDDSDEHIGSKKLKLSEPDSLPSNAPMSADANLSSDDMRVECLLDRFERERVPSKSNDPLLSRIAGWVPDEQFLEVAGLDGLAWCRVAYDLLELEQSQNDVHIAETFSQPKTAVTPTRMGLTPGLLFDMSRSCWDLDVQANAERLCDCLRAERPVLLVGSPKCKAFMDSRSMDRRDPKFSKTLEAGLSHLKSLMEICRWQNEQGLHEDPHHCWSQNTKALRTLEALSGVRVTKTKHLGAFMTNCSPIVEELGKSSTNPGESNVANSVCHVSFARPTTNTGRSHWSHRQYRSWTDCGRGIPCAEACK